MADLAAPTRVTVSLALAATLLATALSLAPTALAQVPDPTVAVTLQGASQLDLGAANTTTLDGSVAYADTAPAVPGGATQATLTLDFTIPEGWSATLEPSSPFTLAPGASAPFTITLTAPAAGEGDATGAVTVTAAATTPDGRSATGEASVTATRVDPPPPPVPWYQTPGGIAAIAGVVFLVAALVAFLAHRRRQARLAAEAAAVEAAARAAYLDRETGIRIAIAEGPLQYGHRREVVYRLGITNASPRPRVGLLDVAEATNGWRAATQVAKVPLAAGETQHVTLVVTPDAVITPGDRATIVVRVKPEEARELDERLTLEVVAPKSGVPTDPHYKIVAVQREGANKQLR